MTLPYPYWNIAIGLLGLFVMVWGQETDGTKKMHIEVAGGIVFAVAIVAAFLTAGIKYGIVFVLVAIPTDWIIRDGIRALVKRIP